jgi:putative endonuclease
MSGRRQLGAWGEGVAALALEAKGYELLERNWRCTYGEVDLVVRKGPWLVFVEVKTRRGRAMGTPEAAVTPQKAERLELSAQHYLLEKGIVSPLWRIDVVAVELDAQGKLLRCEHTENALSEW